MTTKRADYVVPIFCAFVALTSVWALADERDALESCRVDLDQEHNLRDQAERIEYKLISEAADDWCSDSIDDAYDALRMCEEEGAGVRSFGCNGCWDSWNMDMEGACRSMTYDFQDEAEDTILLRSAQLLWDDYADARMRDCESRTLKTVQEFDKCLGPANRRKEISHALEAMFIHQQSKSF